MEKQLCKDAPYLRAAKEAEALLNQAVIEWDGLFETLKNRLDDAGDAHLFSQIEFLMELEDVRGHIRQDLDKLQQCHLEIQGAFDARKIPMEDQKPMQERIDDVAAVLKKAGPVLEEMDGNLAELYAQLLDEAQAQIDELQDKLTQARQEQGAAARDEWDLDSEMELRELRDLLENLKETRLNADPAITEDEDSILQILDSQVITCDNALSIYEASP